MELKEVIKYIKESAEGIKVSPDAILNGAVQIYLSGKIAEERRGVPPRPDKDFDNKPTAKQLNLLKSLGYEIPPTMTFDEAKIVIGELLNNKNDRSKK